MANRKLTDKILAKIADRLPKQEYQFLSKRLIKKDDAIMRGLNIPDHLLNEDTLVHKPVKTNYVNHKNRLKTVYKDEGKVGVYKYVMPFIDDDKKHEALKFIHSLPI